MKIQVALDFGTLEDNIALVHSVEDKVDIIEVGTPLIFRYGIFALQQIREQFPQHQVLFDGKIVDAGGEEAKIAFDAGANIVTVLSTAHDATLQAALDVAHSAGGLVLADLIGQPSPATRAGTLVKMGIDLVGIHIAHDIQGADADFVAEFEPLKGIVDNDRIAIAGGINPALAKKIAPYKPGITIIGTALAAADNPRKMLDEVRKILEVAE